MLTHHQRPVCLSFMSFDLPLWSVVETAATLYQRDQERFHILLTEPLIRDSASPPEAIAHLFPGVSQTPRLLWLEISPSRVIMTMQGNGQFSYRHFWERGVYGLSRYWLRSDELKLGEQIRLRNFTRDLAFSHEPVPEHLRIEYELWSNQLPLGRYVLNLEIQA